VSGGTVLVTGAAGFVGGWLLPELRARGGRVVGTYKPGAPPASFEGEWEPADLREPEQVDALLGRVRPAAVVHLAALAVPREAARDVEEALRVNLGAVDSLIRAIAERSPRARLLYVGSGEVYGRRPAGAPPAREDDALRPETVYASTKAAADLRAALASERDGLDVVRARPFHHTGPGRPPVYAETSFAQQIAEIEAGVRDPVLRVGNLDVIRDFCDVRDVVRAYTLLLERGERGAAYNVCSGEGRTIRLLLARMMERARRPLRIEVDPDRFEPARLVPALPARPDA
jgi:GDP-4-dehydro-6-deoxy-D-mannose reductase